MPSPPDFEETQALDSDSPRCVDGDDGGLMDPDLLGETQALEDPEFDESDGEAGACDWGKTQALDDEDDGGSERTELLSDNEGLLDGGTSRCGVTVERPCCGKDEGLLKKGMQYEEKKEHNVDSDALTDDEHSKGVCVSSLLHQKDGGYCRQSPGPLKKSFTAVRAASLRSSGLAARNFTPKTTSTKSECPRSNDKSNRREENDASGHSCRRVLEFDMQPNSTMNLVTPGAGMDAKDLENTTENSHRCTWNYYGDEKCISNNAGVKKLFEEMTLDEKETTCNDYAGLSYVGSQEPGLQSQANALDVVENFLLVNDVGSSQIADIGKAHMVKSPPTSNAKGSQSLAQRVNLRSPVGRAGIFEWVDSLEDEGGGDFFTKKKDSFFKDKGKSRKAQSLPAKLQSVPFGATEFAINNDAKKECMNQKNNMNLTSLGGSDSRVVCSSVTSGEAHISEIRTNKNLLKDLDEQSKPEHSEQQREATDCDQLVENMYPVGPDTQMAAEAMEALGQTSTSCGIRDNGNSLDGVNVNSSDDKVSKDLRKKALSQQGASVSDTDGVRTRSKCKRTPILKVSKGCSTHSSKLPSSSALKMDIEDAAGTIKTNGIKLSYLEFNAGIVANGNESSISPKRKKEFGAMDGTFIDDAENCDDPLPSKDQPSLTEKLHHIRNFTPIAQRTRRSKQKRQGGTLSCVEKDMSILLNGDNAKDVKEMDDGSGSLMAKRSSGVEQISKLRRPSMSRTQALDVKRLHEEESNIRFRMEDVFIHPKRRRTSPRTLASSASDSNGKSKNALAPVNDMQTTIAKSSTKPRKKTFIKSVRGILDKAIQKKRSTSVHMESYIDMVLPNSKSLPIVSGSRTRSSVHSSTIKHHPEKKMSQCLLMSALTEAVLADAVNTDTIAGSKVREHHTEVLLHGQSEVSFSSGKCTVKNAKLDQSPKEKVQPSGLASGTPSKNVDAVSPVCVVEDYPRTPGTRGLSKSAIARELIRLEAAVAAPMQISKVLRRRKDMASVRVLFSQHLDEDIIKQQKKILARLGVPLASSMSDATHFVTDRFLRTRNMLEAMALGKPVVTHLWLESCGQACCFIDEKNYILRDLKKEKEIGFSMPASLAQASQWPLLQGIRVFITPNVKPSREVIVSLIKATEGQPIERIGRSAIKDDKISEDLLVISCEEDYSVCAPLLEKGAEVFSAELILNGIVIQKLEYARHRLFLHHVKRTRSTIWLRHEVGARFVPVSKCS